MMYRHRNGSLSRAPREHCRLILLRREIALRFHVGIRLHRVRCVEWDYRGGVVPVVEGIWMHDTRVPGHSIGIYCFVGDLNSVVSQNLWGLDFEIGEGCRQTFDNADVS